MNGPNAAGAPSVRLSVAGTVPPTGAPASAPRLKCVAPEPTVNDDGGGSYGATMLAEAGCSGESADACIAKALTPASRQPFAATSSILAKPLPGKGVAAIVEAAGRASLPVTAVVHDSRAAAGGAVT